MAQYDAIAEAYQDSKQLAFRDAIERYTLFELLGDIGGLRVLDLACGEGFYTRRLKAAGASEVTGVDLSAGMIELAEEQEKNDPVGCRYVCSDAADFEPEPESADLVVAMYLLHYAVTRDKLMRFLAVCHRALEPGGRFVGFNDNVLNPPRGTHDLSQYGIVKTSPEDLKEGDPVHYEFTNDDGTVFGFDNHYFAPETYAEAFRESGFQGFAWHEVMLHPAERGNPFWDPFLASSPIIGFSATK